MVHRRECENWTPQGTKLACSWGVQVSETLDPSQAHVMATSIPALLQQYGLESFDYAKIDIEGAERRVFAVPPAWVHGTKLITIEVHEEEGNPVTAASLVAAAVTQPEFVWTMISEYHVYIRRDLYDSILKGSSSKPDAVTQE